MPVPEPDEKGKFRHIPSERETSEMILIPGSGDSQQMLEAILRQEALFQNFAKEQAAWRLDMQSLFGDLRNRIVDVRELPPSGARPLRRSRSDHSIFSQGTYHSHSAFVKEVAFVKDGGSSQPSHSSHPLRESNSDHSIASDASNGLPDPRLSSTTKPSANSMDATMAAARQIKKEHSLKQQTNKVLGIFGRAERLVMHTKSPLFEYSISGVIFVNVICTSVHLQWQGLREAKRLGLRGDDSDWSNAETGFEIAEKLFCAVFFMELLLRMWAFGRAFFSSLFNWLDGAIVLFTFAETFILRPMHITGGMNLASLRVMRAFRVFRIIKVVRFTEQMREMRVLIRTLIASWRGVGWSMFLVMAIIVASAITHCALSQPFLDDPNIGLEQRRDLYEMFGTTTLSFQTMFEGTFTGRWAIYTRRLFKDISPLFALFWIPYVVCVNFALMRVIAALFLKQTLAIADQDTERRAMEKMKEKEKFAKELREIFAEADRSGDGAISRDEFEAMIRFPSVVQRFAKLDLELDEVVALFGVLSADDGDTDYDEFLHAALKMKSSARTIDTVQILHQTLETHRAVAELKHSMSLISQHSSRNSPRNARRDHTQHDHHDQLKKLEHKAEHC